jgi:hypothetical protein
MDVNKLILPDISKPLDELCFLVERDLFQMLLKNAHEHPYKQKSMTPSKSISAFTIDGHMKLVRTA